MILLPPGRHSNFPWESYPAPVQSLANKVIKLGPYKIITIESGYVAKTLNKGTLEILEEGQHLLIDAAHVFCGYIPVKQETKRLEKVTAITKDNVGITMLADVIYKIESPKVTLRQVDDIERSILEISEMQLSQVIGHHNLDELIPAARGFTHKQVDEDEADDDKKGISGVVNELIDTIRVKLADLGIKLINIGMKSWTINDKALAHELGQGAVVQSQTSAKLLTAESDANILKIKAQAQADSEIIRADGLFQAGQKLNSDPMAKQLAQWQAQSKIVASSKPGTSLFYGANGHQGFFHTPLANRQQVSDVQGAGNNLNR